MRLRSCRWLALLMALLVGCATSIQSRMEQYQESARSAAAAGNANAAEALGRAYYLGFMPMTMNDGITYYIPFQRDHTKAYQYLKQAADGNELQAAALAGILVMNGDGTPRDEAQAMAYFQKSANVNVESRYYLSQFYYRSADPQTRLRGFDLVKNAENSDEPELVGTLAMYYDNGVGVKKDKVKASKLKDRQAALLKERDELVNRRVAAFKDNAKRQDQYSAAFGVARGQMIALIAVLSVITTAAFIAASSGNVNLAGGAPPPPQPLSPSQMIAIGIIK